MFSLWKIGLGGTALNIYLPPQENTNSKSDSRTSDSDIWIYCRLLFTSQILLPGKNTVQKYLNGC